MFLSNSITWSTAAPEASSLPLSQPPPYTPKAPGTQWHLSHLEPSVTRGPKQVPSLPEVPGRRPEPAPLQGLLWVAQGNTKKGGIQCGGEKAEQGWGVSEVCAGSGSDS